MRTVWTMDGASAGRLVADTIPSIHSEVNRFEHSFCVLLAFCNYLHQKHAVLSRRKTWLGRPRPARNRLQTEPGVRTIRSDSRQSPFEESDAMPTTIQRRAAILTMLDRDGSVRTSDLVHLLGAGAKTIRHDLRVLAHSGQAVHVRGGALATPPARHHTGPTDRGGPNDTTYPEERSGRGNPGNPSHPGNLSKLNNPGNRRTRSGRGSPGDPADEDAAIALRAAQLVAPHTTLGLGSGRITLRIAHALARTPGLTVVTTSPAIALAFTEHEEYGQQIVLVGGVATAAGGCVGSIAVATIRQLAFDQLILQAVALDSIRGLLSPTHLQAETDRAMIDATRDVVVVANQTAWNAVALAPIVPLGAVTTLVTSTAPTIDAQAIVRAMVGEMHLVDTVGTRFMSDAVH